MKRMLSFELGLNAIPKHLPQLFEKAPHVRAKLMLDFWLLRFFALVCFLSC